MSGRGTSGPSWDGWARGAYDGVRRFAGDPRTKGFAAAGPRTVGYLRRLRAAAAGEVDETLAGVRLSPALAAQVFLDEVLIAAARHPRLMPRSEDYPVAAADVREAQRLFADRGWLDDPRSYHRDPPPPDDVTVSSERTFRGHYEHVRFASDWEPAPDEPRRDRWLGHAANREVHAWVVRADPPSDRWLVGVHGFGMGRPVMDLGGFRAAQLGRLGLNVVLPVLPLHGPRADGPARGEGFMSIDLVDAKHGLAQSAWDVRRVLAWLRASEGAQRVGVYGVSLGGHVAALVAALQDGLDCVVAGIPVVDLPALYRRHSPPEVRRLAEQHGVLGAEADAVHRVVSPLAMPALVAADRRFVFGGLGDRMSTFDQSRRLWEHWGRPAFERYPGGHIGFFWSGQVRDFLVGAFEATGLLTQPAAVS